MNPRYGYELKNQRLGSAVRHRVLRNTYWLLALSLIPTVMGAWLGVATSFASWSMARPGLSLLLFMGGALALIFGIQQNRNSGVGVALLLGFTFFMGLMLSRLLSLILGLQNGSTLIMLAFGGTAAIFAVMATVATVSKKDFSGLGQWLMIGVFLILIASLANIWLKIPALMLTISILSIAIFSAYMLFDVQRIINGGETNYISATLAIYLDVYNVFVNLLSLLGVLSGNRE